MPITIGSNINSLRTLRRLDDASSARERTFERLSSGSRINRASDDAAGLSIALSLKATSRVSSQAVRNISDGVSFLNIADGATGELKNILIRLRELATQSSNGTFSNVQRQSLDKEAQALQTEYNRIIDTSKFNGLSVFSRNVAIQAGKGTDAVLAVGTSSSSSSATYVGDGTFQARKVLTTGSAYGVATADLNGDGLLDLVTADGSPNVLGVLLGNGDGTFKARVSFATGTFPYAVTIADLNGDGVLDLVTGDRDSNTASVLLGNGDGTFKVKKSFSTGTAPISVAIADFNGDGVLDLAAADRDSNTTSVLLGNGDGTFQAKRSFTTGSAPYWIATADLNGDGVLDLVTTDRSSSTASVLLGNGDGTFKARTSLAAGSAPNSVAIADLNGDGVLDLAIANYTSGTSIFLGNGNGTFKERASFATGTSPTSVTLADFNGDGMLDLVVGSYNDAAINVLLGNGNGTFKVRTSFGTGQGDTSIAIGDFNGDGVIDVVTGDTAFSTTSVILGNGVAASSAQASLTPLSGVSVATRGAALTAQGRIDSYLDEVNLISSSIGVGMSRLAVASSNLQSNIEATKAAEARITDVDVAEESARLVSTGILQQAAAAVLSHANQEPALALKLLNL